MHHPTTAILGLCFSLSLISCNRSSFNDSPLGPVTQTGTLTATGVSLMRRGTHVLSIHGKSLYYLESKTQDLEPFGGKEVVISGRAEGNIYAKYLPIIVVDRVQLVGGTTELREWKIPKLSLTLTTPAEWKADLKDQTATFSLAPLTEPFLVISRETGKDLPPGRRIFHQGRMGVEIYNEEAMTDDVRFLDGNAILSISFHPNIHELATRSDYDRLHDAFSSMITSLSFGNVGSSRSNNATSAPSTGSGSGTPCGGAAGILCAPGFYCSITDVEQGIGKCTGQ